MARKRKLSQGKQEVIAGLLQEYDINTAQDIQEALKDLLGVNYKTNIRVS